MEDDGGFDFENWLAYGKPHGFRDSQDAARYLLEYLEETGTRKTVDALRYILETWNVPQD